MRNYNSFKDILLISDYSRVRKHRQIVDSVLSATTLGSLKLNDKLPSVNELAIDYNVSRDTVVRAYAFLKENDIIDSVPGKGYYVKSINNSYKAKVFLLINNLSPCIKKMYDAFTEGLQGHAVVDFHICQNDYNQFKKHILNSKSKEYTHYVLAVNFDEEEDDYIEFVKNEVPVEKLILLNTGLEKLGNQVSCVYQNFETDFFQLMEELKNKVNKYNGFKLILPKSRKIPRDIRKSFENYCKQFNYSYNVIQSINSEIIEPSKIYVDFEDDESLVQIIKKINNAGFEIGREVGILSYDDNPLKELLAGGITVFTPSFTKIGYQAAELILEQTNKRVVNPLKVIIRKSL